MTAQVARKVSRVSEGLAHPLRVRALSCLSGDRASPMQLAKLLGAPLGNVSYHVRVLKASGLVRQAGQRPRRGAVEHFYTLTSAGEAVLDLLDELAAVPLPGVRGG